MAAGAAPDDATPMRLRERGARGRSPLLPDTNTNMKLVTTVAAVDLIGVAAILTPIPEVLRVLAALVAGGCSLVLARAVLGAAARLRVLAGQAEGLRARLTSSELERQELDRSRLIEARRSSTDELTGLLNRRALKEEIRKEANRAVRSGRPLAFLFLDVDHFKAVNDEYGHATGDEVLVELSLRIRSAVRDYDLFGRWGGDEFCLIAPEHRRRRDTETLAEHLRAAVSKTPFETTRGSLRITISVGAVLIDPPTPTPEAMCDLADVALYRAKRAGRNRVEVDEPGLDSAHVA
jgi:diguanylate cyclase (GGDEF)-like protein